MKTLAALITLVIMLVYSSCTTFNELPQEINDSSNIYPSIYYSIKKAYPVSIFTKVDVLRDKYRAIGMVEQYEDKEYKFEVSFERRNNSMHYKILKILEKKGLVWVAAKKYQKELCLIISDKIDQKYIEIESNAEIYRTYYNLCIDDPSFLLALIETLPGKNMKIFINTTLGSHLFNIKPFDNKWTSMYGIEIEEKDDGSIEYNFSKIFNKYQYNRILFHYENVDDGEMVIKMNLSSALSGQFSKIEYMGNVVSLELY